MANISQIKTGISLLKWQVSKGKINPKALGYVCPNGTINFQTTEAAQTYAKNRVLSALQAPKPFERAVFVEDSRIIGDINGTVHKVEFDSKNLLNGHNDVMLVHGHPIGTPLSDPDYACLIANNRLNSIVAYNKRGEYSKMTKQKKPFIFRLFSQKVWDNVRRARILTSKSMFEEINNKDWIELIKRTVKLKETHKDMIKEEVLATEEGKKLQDLAKQLLTKINNIWAKNEKFFGIKYECDFSKLV